MLETSLHHLFFFIATDPDHIKLCQKYFYTRGTKEINFDLAIITNRALLQFQLIIHSIQPTTLTTSVTPPTIKLIPSHTHFSNHQRIVHLLVQQTASPFFIVIISSFGDIWYTQSQMRNARSLNIQTMDTPYIHIRKAARLEIRNGLHMASKWQLLHLLSSGLHIVLDNKHGLGGQKLQGKHVYGGNYLGGLRVDISHHTTSLSFQVCHPISSFFFHLPYNSNNFASFVHGQPFFIFPSDDVPGTACFWIGLLALKSCDPVVFVWDERLFFLQKKTRSFLIIFVPKKKKQKVF